MPLRTEIDVRALIKGSRDPIGAQAIRTLFGRLVVGGQRMNTTSVRNFVVLLLGYWLFEKREDVGPQKKEPAVLIWWKQQSPNSRDLPGGSNRARPDDERQDGTRRSKRVLLEIHDQLPRAINTGRPLVSRLVPLPGDRRSCHGGSAS